MQHSITLFISFIVLWSGIAEPKTLATDAPLSVIVNNSVPVDQMSMEELKASLLGEKIRWTNKQKMTLAMMKSNTEVGKKVDEKVLNMSANGADKYYLTMVFQGKIASPKTFSNEDQLIEYVAETPGAIGVISYRQTSQVKFIKINGNINLQE